MDAEARDKLDMSIHSKAMDARLPVRRVEVRVVAVPVRVAPVGRTGVRVVAIPRITCMTRAAPRGWAKCGRTSAAEHQPQNISRACSGCSSCKRKKRASKLKPFDPREANEHERQIISGRASEATGRMASAAAIIGRLKGLRRTDANAWSHGEDEAGLCTGRSTGEGEG